MAVALVRVHPQHVRGKVEQLKAVLTDKVVFVVKTHTQIEQNETSKRIGKSEPISNFCMRFG